MMLRPRFFYALPLAALLAAAAVAQERPDAAPREGDDPSRESPEAIELQRQAVDQFDADDDGQLGEQEQRRARAFLQALRRELGDRGDRAVDAERRRAARDGERDRPRGPRDADPRAGDGRRPPRDGDLGPGAPEIGDPPPPRPPRGPARPMQLFAKFDADANGELNRAEFGALMAALRERGGLRGIGPGQPDGPRFGPRDRGDAARRGRRPGPPRDGERPLDEAPPFEGPAGPTPEFDGDSPTGPSPGDRERRRPPRDSEESDSAKADAN
jgi:hypothetical protein